MKLKYTLILAMLGALAAWSSASAGDEQESAAEKRIRKYEKRARIHILRAHPLPEDIDPADFEPLPYVVLPDRPHSYFINSNLIAEEGTTLQVQNESSIAVNPTNPDNLIASAVDYRESSSTWVYVSHDGGTSWENISLGHPFPQWRSTNDPSVTFGADGRGYLVYGGFGNPNTGVPGQNGVFISITEDEGRTWTTHNPIILHDLAQTEDSTFEDKYYIESDNSAASPYFGNLYCPWKRVIDADSSTQIVMARSLDKGLTWLPPVPVSDRLSGTSEDTTFGQSFPISTTGPNGQVYCAWNWGPRHSVGFSRSLDGGQSFSEPRVIHTYEIFGIAREIPESGLTAYRHTLKGLVRAEAYPTIQCDVTNGERRGWLYLCWAADQVPNIYFSRSTDGGETWTEPKTVHSDPTNDQFWPWLSIDPTNGDLAVMYLDSRDDPENIEVHCYVAYSNDGGDTWTDRRVSDLPTDIRLNPFTGSSFAGDYSGNAFYDGKVYPSWYDTRRGSNLSDVFTAIVDINKPTPVLNAEIEVFPDRPTELELRWEPPTERAFGTPLDAGEFTYAVYRDGLLIHQELPPQTQSVAEVGLEAYREYRYEIFVNTADNQSYPCRLAAYAGGTRKPDKARIIAIRGGGGNDTQIDVRVPSLRGDSLTPFVNPGVIRVYRDGELTSEHQVNPGDTSRVVTVIDEAPEPGFYRYRVSITDDSTPPNESDQGEEFTLYTGPVNESISESFDGASLPKYLISGEWERTEEIALSAPSCLTESRGGDYSRNEEDIIVFFPFVRRGFDRAEIRFAHAAILEPRDSAIVEYSVNSLDNWQQLASYNREDYEPWGDGEFNADDWKMERLSIDGPAGDTIYVRFRFRSNLVLHDRGWYVDDLNYQVVTDVQDLPTQALIRSYPNPVNTLLTLSSEAPLNSYQPEVEIFDIFGRRCNAAIVRNDEHHIVLNVASLAPGTYNAIVRHSGAQQTVRFVVAR